ncbi:hypothetical protein KW807_02320 [Candidatus Parcubacteria bacterium]|nr:hypothetical protein [Candidatus Parcubacteria bacterium]
MEPQFQSSFIPKGPAGAGLPAYAGGTPKQRNLLGVIGGAAFTISVLLAVGAFGYQFYLKYTIAQMETQLEEGTKNLDESSIQEITNLDSRIISASELINNHLILSPLFRALEENTLRSVRLTKFNFTKSDMGLVVNMDGEASSYAALALQADNFKSIPMFKNPTFSDLQLDDKGNVKFTFRAGVDSTGLSYQTDISNLVAPTASTTVDTFASTTPSIDNIETPQ